jgi:hypothetical protein
MGKSSRYVNVLVDLIITDLPWLLCIYFVAFDFTMNVKQKNNLFNLNSLYKRISNRPFIKGKKQYLELIMMYFWLHEIVGDEENYWQEYLEKVSII